MAEYIERETLMRKIHAKPEADGNKRAAQLLEYILSAPAADVAPVVHGRWVDDLVRDWKCSECGKKVPKQVHFDGYCYDDKLQYCPNCGARMNDA